jgi:AcrR family transcriptional regulator
MTEVLETRPEVRRRRKAERPQEILEAAFIEFSRNGYASTTLDQIAERAGVTKGTIYVYFENKEHLFISMVREITKSTFDTVHGMLETHEGSTADLLRAQFSFMYQHILEDRRRREVVRMLIAEAPRFPELPTAITRKSCGPASTCCGRRSSAAWIVANSGTPRLSTRRKS